MNHELIGKIAGGIVILSAIPYMVRVWQGKIVTKTTSWALWSLIGLAILLTYRSSGARENLWAAVFGFTNPTIITLLSVFKQGEKTKPTRTDWYCIIISVSSIIAWWCVNENQNLAKYALCLALVADVFAAIPTIGFLKDNPSEDRPFAWAAFAFAYGLNIFAVSEPSFANYVLPVWMVVGGGIITWMLIRYRIRERIPFRDWI